MHLVVQPDCGGTTTKGPVGDEKFDGREPRARFGNSVEAAAGPAAYELRAAAQETDQFAPPNGRRPGPNPGRLEHKFPHVGQGGVCPLSGRGHDGVELLPQLLVFYCKEGLSIVRDSPS